MLLAVEQMDKADGFVNWLDSDVHSQVADVYVPGLQEVIAGSVTPEALMEEVHTIAEQIHTLEEE